jgi:hypothetical protein
MPRITVNESPPAISDMGAVTELHCRRFSGLWSLKTRLPVSIWLGQCEACQRIFWSSEELAADS